MTAACSPCATPPRVTATCTLSSASTSTVEPGEIHAIVGLNGAGKTTAMKAVVGHTALDAGSVSLFGVPAADAGAAEFSRLGFVIDHPFGYPELTVRDNIVHAGRLHGIGRERRGGRGGRVDRPARTRPLGALEGPRAVARKPPAPRSRVRGRPRP